MKLQGRALLCILTTVIAGVGVGCSGPPPTSDPYAEDLRQAKELATSDFERAALEDGKVMREEYEEAAKLRDEINQVESYEELENLLMEKIG